MDQIVEDTKKRLLSVVSIFNISANDTIDTAVQNLRTIIQENEIQTEVEEEEILPPKDKEEEEDEEISIPPPLPQKREREQTSNKKNTKIPKLDVAAFLLHLQENVVDEGDHVQQVIDRITRSDYLLVLIRAWCVHNLLPNKKAVMAERLGSKAKNKKSSSLITQAYALHTLIIDCKMHRLRFLSPTREQMLTLLTSTKEIKNYLDKYPDEYWQSKEELSNNVNDWVVLVKK